MTVGDRLGHYEILRSAGSRGLSLGVAILLLTLGCNQSERAAAARARQEAAVRDVTERIARIEAAVLPMLVIAGQPVRTVPLEERMAELGVPGVGVAVIENGEIAWARGWGVADVASGREVTSRTLFQAASISKPVAGLAALRLVDEGRIDLDTDINEYLMSWKVPDNGFTGEQKVTLRGLLNHSAGTTVWGFPGYGPGEEVPSTIGVLDGTGNTDPIRVFKEPGESWRYSGGGYTVMQLLVEDVTGRPFVDVLRESVLGPANMTLSTYEQPLPADRHDQAATAYRPDGTPVDGRFHTYPEMAAAGLWTTPTDLVRFALAIQAAAAGEPGAILSPALTREMLTPGMNDHGLGPAIAAGGERFGHGGSNAGFRCQLIAFTDGRGGVAVMTNSGNGGRLAQEIILTVAAEYGWPGLEPDERRVVTLQPEEYERLAGAYRVPELTEPAEVRYEDGRLWLAVPGDEPVELLPESATEFFLRDGTPVAFEIEGETIDIVAMGSRGRKVAR